MTSSQFRKLVKQYGGWIEGDVAFFLTVHARRQFEQSRTVTWEPVHAAGSAEGNESQPCGSTSIDGEAA